MSSSYRLRQPKCTKHCHWASCWGVSRETTLIKKVISLFGRGYPIRGERASWTPNFHWFNWNGWFNRYFNNINRWSWYRTSISHIEGEAPAWYRPFIDVYTSFEAHSSDWSGHYIKSVYETQSWTPEARTDGCPRSYTVDDSSGNGF